MFERFCNKNSGWRRWKYCALACAKQGTYKEKSIAYEGTDCSIGGEPAGPYKEELSCDSKHGQVRMAEAKAVCEAKNLRLCENPKGKCAKGVATWSGKSCGTELRVHSDGKVSAQVPASSRNGHQANRFNVVWSGTVPETGEVKGAQVKTEVVFKRKPSSCHEVRNKLKIGAFKPKQPCSECGGPMKIFGKGFDEDTIFECDGTYYKNIRSTVQVGDSASFQNPPVFMRSGPAGADQNEEQKRRAAFYETESLIDHLFHHPNTPVNIGKKLIQRFVTSNPSPEYTEAVAKAFSSGRFGGTQRGMVFSGKYGDLGATLAAILLHPEARQQTEPRNGLLREPMLKLFHLLRAMEYKDNYDDPIMLSSDLDDRIGQFPYKSPTVFNYYNADFVPASLNREIADKPGAEPIIAPEFQIFTPPLSIGMMNGLTALVKNGISNCDSGFGFRTTHCKRGEFKFVPSDASDSQAVVKELNTLLTGGRLTSTDAGVVKAAYDNADDGEKLRAAQTATLFTPGFNTLGKPTENGKTRPVEVPKRDHQPKPYKAVVLAFLAGGADTFNMLVPRDCKLHEDYAATRAGINLPIKDLLPIQADGQVCKNFGINPNMPNLHKLYQAKEASFVSNVGGLMEPGITRHNLRGGGMKSCPSQFSHSHGQTLAQTMQCGAGATVPRGVGGKMADELGKKGMNTASFSVSGSSAWTEGRDTQGEILDARLGAVRFKAYDEWKEAIATITAQQHGNSYCEGYAKAFADAVNSSETVGQLLDNGMSDSLKKYRTDSALKSQFYQVARMIATRKERKAERDFFFVQQGGWDHHQGIRGGLEGKLETLDEALAGFVTELKSQGIFDSVVIATESEFGRTLTFNGEGTDHGWGGNHIVIGGGINGGQVFNDFLETYASGSDYVTDGRARVIPKYPWESMMVPISQWVGVDKPEDIFPNLGHFNDTHLIPMQTKGKKKGLFK